MKILTTFEKNKYYTSIVFLLCITLSAYTVIFPYMLLIERILSSLVFIIIFNKLCKIKYEKLMDNM